MGTSSKWSGHWYDLCFEDYEDDPIALDKYGTYERYNPEGYIENVYFDWNRHQYELIQAEGAEEFERYWEEDWNKRMAMQRMGINIPFAPISTRQHGEFLETFEPEFQCWFLNNIPQEEYQNAIKDKKDIGMLNTVYLKSKFYRNKWFPDVQLINSKPYDVVKYDKMAREWNNDRTK